MKKIYFNSISSTIHKWIEANGNLEFEMWKNKNEIIPNYSDGRLYTDMTRIHLSIFYPSFIHIILMDPYLSHL